MLNTNILFFFLLIVGISDKESCSNDFKIIDKRVGFIEIGTGLNIAKKKLIEEGYTYHFDEEFYAHMFMKDNQLKFMISTYAPHDKNIIRGIWIYDDNYTTKYDIKVGTNFETIKNLKKNLDIGLGEISGLPWINLDNKEFRIDRRISLSLTLCDTNKSYYYYDSIYHQTQKVFLTKKEEVIEILLNDPIGEYNEFLKNSNH